MFRVLAVEQPGSTVLNYAPGPLDTPMISELLADTRTDQGELQSGAVLLHFRWLLLLEQLLAATHLLSISMA